MITSHGACKEERQTCLRLKGFGVNLSVACRLVLAQRMNIPHSKFRHVYAVVRIDFPVSVTEPKNSVTVVKVLTSSVLAENEVTRLNKLNAEKGCIYFSHVTRLVE